MTDRLTKAISILILAHTKDDPALGYVVMSQPDIDAQPFTRQQYIQAWGTLREAFRGEAPDFVKPGDLTAALERGR